MKLRIMKGLIAFTLCASMVLTNIQLVNASLPDAAMTNDNIDQVVATPEGTGETPTIVVESAITEVTPTPTVPTEPTTSVTPTVSVTPNPEITPTPEVTPTPEITPAPDEQTSGEDEVTVSDNSLTTVSDNQLEQSNLIENLKKTEDGTAYILEKEVEGKEVTINMYIPVGLFAEAKELDFKAVPVSTEQEKEIDELFLTETEDNEEIEIKEFAAYDITLLVDGTEVSEFDGSIKIVFNDHKILVTEVPEETVEVYYFDEENKEVEILETQAEGAGSAEAEVEHFTIYGYRILTASERKFDTRNNVLRTLGLGRYFSVFSRNFKTTSHMEGIVAVENLNGAANIDVSDHLFDSDKHASNFSIKLTKNIENSMQGGTFQFAFYETPVVDSSTVPYKTASITVPNGSKTGSTEIEGFDGTKAYYLYELDEEGKPIMQDDIGNMAGDTYQVSYSTDSIGVNTNVITGMGNVSYVKNICGSSNSDLFISKKIVPEAVFGENNEVHLKDNASNMPYIRTKGSDGIGFKLDQNTKVHIAKTSEYPDEFPIDFEKEFAALKEVSASIADLGTNDNIKIVETHVNADGKLNLGSINYITEGKLLIVNINCQNINEVTWEGMPAIDGANSNDWSKNYSNVIYNFYNESNEVKTAYSGKINLSCAVRGTVLAPDAAFESGSNVIGAVIARDVTLGGEVHQLLLTDDETVRTVEVNCTNTDCGETTFSFHHHKSAELENWDERTYNVNLYTDAEKVSTTTVVNIKPTDVVLVLDVSGSMEYDIDRNGGYRRERLNALKNAVRKFITKTAETSPESRIAIVTFNTQADVKNAFTKVDQKGLQELNTTIDKLDANGGTRQDRALKKANNLVNDSAIYDANIILFSDGVPDEHERPFDYSSGYDSWSQYDLNLTVQVATEMVKKNTKVKNLYSIFLGEDNGYMPKEQGDTKELKPYDDTSHHYSKINSGTTYKQWFMGTLPSSGCGYTADSAESLASVFEQISTSIKNVHEVSGTIVDVIDSRFDLLDGEGNPISVLEVKACGDAGMAYGNARLFTTSTEVNGTKVDQIKIVWDNILLPGESAGGWNQTLSLRAKENYAGGNDVPTNGDGSGVFIDTNEDGEKEFFSFTNPTVNVKVQFEVPDAEDVFFLGEKIGDVFTENDLTSKFLNQTTDGITYLKHTVQMDQEEKIYEYTDLRDVLISSEVKEGILESRPSDTTTYEDAVSVLVIPKSLGAISAENMLCQEEPIMNAGIGYDSQGNQLMQSGDQWYYTVCNPVKNSGDYTAYLVDGAFDVTKNIDRKYETETVSEKIRDNQSFVFKIERYDLVNGTYVKDAAFADVYETMNFGPGDSNKQTKTMIGLKTGYYKVTEETDWSWKYKQESVEIKGANEDGFVHIGERLAVNDRVNFKGLDMAKRAYPNAGRYYDLPTEAKNKIDTDITHKNVNFMFSNLFTTDADKKKWLGDVSVMKNLFE